MTNQTSGWQSPPDEAGPAPGVEFAGYGARLVGYILDGILLGIVSTAIIFVGLAIFAGTSSITVDSSGTVDSSTVAVTGAGVTAIVVASVAVILVTLIYFPWFWTHGGQTPGQKVMGIKVVRDNDGGPVSAGSAILRLIGYWVSSLVFYLGYIWVFIDKRRRGWFDLIGGTVVIKAR